MAGGDIEVYLLEKSRVTYQSPSERSYHIFYFMITHEIDLREECKLTENIYDYPLMSMGKVKVESIDDAKEMQIMDEAFDILGFTHKEKLMCTESLPFACSSLSLSSREWVKLPLQRTLMLENISTPFSILLIPGRLCMMLLSTQSLR